MHQPTRFGDYLLLKKLSEDPLGQTFRAGRIDGTSVGEIVFLRTFSIPGANAAQLAEAMRKFRAAGPEIRGPGLTYSRESGEIGGVAYTAYAYATGWNVLELIATASSSFEDLERDHALLIVERVAKGLSLVHQADPSVTRPWHGFLVPQNVILSSEGEINLMGFESGPYMAGLATAGKIEAASPHLSPEVRSGETPGPSDDIYSLGALLWTLLIGTPPPLDVASELTSRLASAIMANGSVLPAGLAELLQSSLAAPRVRKAHAGLWHKQLTEWMGRHEVKTTHFDLAFFVHELFRRQMQSEQEEIEKEKQLDLRSKAEPPRPAPAQSPPAQPPTALFAQPDESEMSDVILRPDLSGMVEGPAVAGQTPPAAVAAAESGAVAAPAPRKSRAPLFLGLAALIAAALAAAWFLIPRDVPAEPQTLVWVTESPPEPPSELKIAQTELERLVQERAQTVSDQIALEFDEQISSLREQLREAQAAEAEALRQAAAAGPGPEEAAGAAAVPETEPAAAAPPSEPAATIPPPAESAAEPTTAVVEPAADPRPPAAAPPPPAASPPPEAPAPSVPPPPPAPAAPPSAAPPAQSAAVPVVKPPRRISMPAADYPPRARRLRKEATVLLKVLVGRDGRVLDAKPTLDKPDPYGFDQAAIRAVRGAQFEPATTDGVATQMWTTVVITFKL